MAADLYADEVGGDFAGGKPSEVEKLLELADSD